MQEVEGHLWALRSARQEQGLERVGVVCCCQQHPLRKGTVQSSGPGDKLPSLGDLTQNYCYCSQIPWVRPLGRTACEDPYNRILERLQHKVGLVWRRLK